MNSKEDHLQSFYDSINQTGDVAHYCGWTDFDAGGTADNLHVWICGRPDVIGDIVSIENALPPTVTTEEPHGEFAVSHMPVEDLSFDQWMRGDIDLTMTEYKGPWSPEFAGEVQAALLGLAGVVHSENSEASQG